MLLLSVLIGKESTGILSSVEVLVLIIMIIPAWILALFKSKALPIYVLAVWAFGPEVRRYFDWASGNYHSISPISIAPLLCSLAFLLPIMSNPPKLTANLRVAFRWFGLAFFSAFLIGFARYHFSAIYQMLNYVIPMLIVPYMLAVQPSSRDRDRWLAAFSIIAVLVAIYGWIQYFLMPSWDSFWMVHSGMGSIGLPLPKKVRVFSTLNSPGPTANYLAFALVPMLFRREWRGPFGWLGTMAVASVLALTLVRSAWLMTLVGVFVYILLIKKEKRFRLISLFLISGVAFYFILNHIPGANTITQRIQSFGDLGNDYSLQTRIHFTLSFLPNLLHTPLGAGFGSTGVATKLGNGGQLGVNGNFDNGIIDIFYTFGFFFGFMFFRAEWYVLKEIIRGPFVPVLMEHRALAGAMLVAMNLALLSFNNFPGIGGILVWFAVGIGLTIPTKSSISTSMHHGIK